MSASARISEPDASASAAVASAGMKLRVVYRDGAGRSTSTGLAERIAQAIADRQGTLWVDIENAESASTREAETLLATTSAFTRWPSRTRSKNPISPRSTIGESTSTSSSMERRSTPEPMC